MLRRSAYYRALNMSLTFISSKFCIFLTFVLYMTFTDNVLTTSAVTFYFFLPFLLYAFINPMMYFIPSSCS